MNIITKGSRSFSASSVKAALIVPIVVVFMLFVSLKHVIAQTGFDVAEKGAVKILQPREAYELINKNSNNTDFIILDIRTPQEFLNGHIPGAINVNYYSQSFDADLEGFNKKKAYWKRT